MQADERDKPSYKASSLPVWPPLLPPLPLHWLTSTQFAVFQFAYTTLFGWYAAFLFIRTGSVLPPFFAHALCNSLGLPPLAWALQVWPQKKLCTFYPLPSIDLPTLFAACVFRWTVLTLSPTRSPICHVPRWHRDLHLRLLALDGTSDVWRKCVLAVRKRSVRFLLLLRGRGGSTVHCGPKEKQE